YNPQGANSGSFTVAGTSADAQSGIDRLSFPAIAGMSGGGDGASATYGWSAATSASGAQTVTARNGSGLTATADFTVRPDTTGPTGESVALAGGPWYTAASVPLTLDGGTDGGAGVDASSGLVERSEAPLSAGVCGTF